MKKIIAIVLTCLMVIGLTSCYASKEGGANGLPNFMQDAQGDRKPAFELSENPDAENNGADGALVVENSFVDTSHVSVSTFSADVDTASYSYFRKLVNTGYELDELIATAGRNIRTEEMVNYFDYTYNMPNENELFGVSAKVVPCPWNENSKLMMLGLATEKTEPSTDNNLVFLIDVSGSMSSSDKLPLLQKSFSYLVDQLDEGDRVSIVTYAGKEKVVLKGCEGNKKDKIMNAIESLEAEGSTNGEAGLEMAYQVAESYYIEGGNNRIIMASDGDLNVGISSEAGLKSFITEKKNMGIYLSVLGFGTGNYKDSKMETLADNGNGVYYYIDSEREAEKIFGEDIFATLYTVAKNVKLQLRFDKSTVKKYRLIGYENRLLNNEDYLDDTKDAGEIGAGHTVTVCYEIILQENAPQNRDFAELGVRYMKPDSDKSEEQTFSVKREYMMEEADDDAKFICAVIETSMILYKSKYIGDITLENVFDELCLVPVHGDEYKMEFVLLLEKLCSKNYQERL